jgi:secretion/DNA translocation related TadE-like protein
LRPRRFRPANERGSATLVGAVAIAGLLACTIGGLQLGSAVVARHRAQAAADLAALSAASAIAAGMSAACGRAGQVARTMRTTLGECRVDGLDVVVGVDAPVVLARWGFGPAHAAARAGPAD